MGRKKVLIAFAVILCLIVNTLPVFAATSPNDTYNLEVSVPAEREI